MFQWLFKRNANPDDSDIDLSPLDAPAPPVVEYDICGRPWRVTAAAATATPGSPAPANQHPPSDKGPFAKYLELRGVHEQCAPDWEEKNPELARIAESSTIQAYKEFADQLRILGRQFTDEERRKWVFDRAADLVTTRVAAFEKNRRRDDEEEGGEILAELRKLRATVQSQAKPNGPLDAANAFWNDHPFLSGMVGSYAFHRLKQRR